MRQLESSARKVSRCEPTKLVQDNKYRNTFMKLVPYISCLSPMYIGSSSVQLPLKTDYSVIQKHKSVLTMSVYQFIRLSLEIFKNSRPWSTMISPVYAAYVDGNLLHEHQSSKISHSLIVYSALMCSLSFTC